MHRIGRTGRSQRTGTAYTFFTPGNARQASDLVAVLREANQVINPKLYEMAEMSKGLGGRGNVLRYISGHMNIILTLKSCSSVFLNNYNHHDDSVLH